MNKKSVVYVALLIALSFTVGRIWDIPHASAQTNPPTPLFISPQVATAISGCAQPVGATLPKSVTLCFVDTGVVATSGFYFAIDGSPTFNPLVPPSASAGVTGFGTPPRTGNVVLTKADILATGVAVTTTATSTVQ
jgi:hypothetical protein